MLSSTGSLDFHCNLQAIFSQIFTLMGKRKWKKKGETNCNKVAQNEKNLLCSPAFLSSNLVNV